MMKNLYTKGLYFTPLNKTALFVVIVDCKWASYLGYIYWGIYCCLRS